MRTFYRAFATGVTCRQWTLTPPDTWSRLYWDLHIMFYLGEFYKYCLWVVSMEHLQRLWHASRKRLPFRTPRSVSSFGTCLWSNCWDQIPRTCHVFTRLFALNTPWYFLDFDFKESLKIDPDKPNTIGAYGLVCCYVSAGYDAHLPWRILCTK